MQITKAPPAGAIADLRFLAVPPVADSLDRQAQPKLQKAQPCQNHQDRSDHEDPGARRIGLKPPPNLHGKRVFCRLRRRLRTRDHLKPVCFIQEFGKIELYDKYISC